MNEAQHQTTLFRWAQQPIIRHKYPELKLLFHIPNGGRRDPIEAKHLKQQGVKRGVPDLCLPIAKKGFNALYIELKTDKGIVSEYQKWWLTELSKVKNKAVVCRGWKEAAQCLIEYLS